MIVKYSAEKMSTFGFNSTSTDFCIYIAREKKKLMYNDEEEVQAKTNNVQIDHAPNLMQNFINWNEMKQKSKINN